MEGGHAGLSEPYDQFDEHGGYLPGPPASLCGAKRFGQGPECGLLKGHYGAHVAFGSNGMVAWGFGREHA